MTPLPASAIVNDPSPRLRILLRGANWIGDAVMTMPAVQRLRELHPRAYIALACPEKLHDLWRHNPFLTEVIPFRRGADIPTLRQAEFDLAVIFPNSFRSAWECYRAKIPRRVGFEGHWRRRLLTDIVAEPRSEVPIHERVAVADRTFAVKHFASMRHQAHRYLDLVAYLGGNRDLVQPKIYLRFDELPPLSKFFRDDGRPLIAINPGAEYGPAKRWMPTRFAEVAIRVSQQFNCRWLIVGGPGDRDLARGIADALAAANMDADAIINVAGQTTLAELCVLLKRCRLCLTNDTGPMHIAYALGTPIIAIFGSTAPELTGPLGDRSCVIRQPVECSPCFLRECPIDFRCMTRITVDQVVDAVLKHV